jgi:hypothetical protein
LLTSRRLRQASGDGRRSESGYNSLRRFVPTRLTLYPKVCATLLFVMLLLVLPGMACCKQLPAGPALALEVLYSSAASWQAVLFKTACSSCF